MKLLLCLFASFVLAFSLVSTAEPFKYEDCSKGKGIASISHFSVSPDPVSLSKNITLSLNMTLHEDIPPNTYVKRNIYKVTSFFGVPVSIPVPCWGNVGSCTTEGCEYLNSLKDQVCPFAPPDLKCECPLKAGVYSGKDVVITMPELGSIMKFLASGSFRVEMRMVKREDNTDKEIACFLFTGRTV